MRTFPTRRACRVEARSFRRGCDAELFARDPEMLFNRVRADAEVARDLLGGLELERPAQALFLAQAELGPSA